MRPEDLTKFGLIPEFIGRLPMVATVKKLDVDALMEILTVPRNAFVKQYQKLFELDDVDPGVHRRRHPRGRRQGARARHRRPRARAILEEVLLHVMYDVPSREDIGKVVVTEEVVVDDVAPTLLPRESEAKKKKSA